MYICVESQHGIKKSVTDPL